MHYIILNNYLICVLISQIVNIILDLTMVMCAKIYLDFKTYFDSVTSQNVSNHKVICFSDVTILFL